MNDIERITQVGRALSVETRVRILFCLGSGPLCVGALAARLEITQSAVSQHLRILRDAGLVSPARHGYFVHYELNEPALSSFAGLTQRFLDSVEQAGCIPGKGDSEMCKSNTRCEKPENLKGKPGECSPEQIRKCHGEGGKHSCEGKNKQQR